MTMVPTFQLSLRTRVLRALLLPVLIICQSAHLNDAYAGAYSDVRSSDALAQFKRESQSPKAERPSAMSGDFTKAITTNPAKSWHIRGTSRAVLSSGDVLYVGGEFSEIYNNSGGSLPRGNLAALDRITGEPTNFAPDIDGKVFSLAVSPDGQTLYVGGTFTKAEGRSRRNIAAYDIGTGELSDFDPLPRGSVRAIAVGDGKVYLGGLFTVVGDTNRSYVAAFNARTGNLDQKFVALPNGIVKALVFGVDRLWLGGDFTRLDGVRQKGVAAVDPEDGTLDPTDEVEYKVTSLAASGTQLFVAGGGRGGTATALNRITGRQQWEISSNGNFQAIGVGDGPFVYLGGHHEAIEGNKSVDRLARHDKRTGATDFTWLPEINGIRSIDALSVEPNALYLGGDFTRVGGERHEGVAIIPGQTDAMDAALPLLVGSDVRRTLDSAKQAGPRWIRLDFPSRGATVHTITISWETGADLRFKLFEADGTPVSSTVRGSSPGVWSGELDANTDYFVALWSANGVADYRTRLKVTR